MISIFIEIEIYRVVDVVYVIDTLAFLLARRMEEKLRMEFMPLRQWKTRDSTKIFCEAQKKREFP